MLSQCAPEVVEHVHYESVADEGLLIICWSLAFSFLNYLLLVAHVRSRAQVEISLGSNLEVYFFAQLTIPLSLQCCMARLG